jgi:uncharacterized protein
MKERLPEIVDPLVFAERRTELKGKLRLNTLTRLSGSLLDDNGSVEVELFFNKKGRHAFIEGSAKTVLLLQCQNCLDSVEIPIAVDIRLGLITTLEQADELPDGYEPLLVDEDKMLLKDIVEDELLLALPAFPKHPLACIKFETNVPDLAVEITKSEQSKPENPFAVLAKLKMTGDK